MKINIIYLYMNIDLLEHYKNNFHTRILMGFYSLRDYIQNDKVIWLYYSRKELQHKTMKVIDYLNMKKENLSILDLGCGNCGMIEYLQFYTKNIYGVDLTSVNINLSKKNLNTIDPSHFVKSDILNFLENDSRKYDFIIIHGVICCFTNEIQRSIIKQCYEKLNTNGVLWLGAIQYENDPGIFATYPMNKESIDFVNSFKPAILNEWNFFGLKKYGEHDKTILIRK